MKKLLWLAACAAGVTSVFAGELVEEKALPWLTSPKRWGGTMAEVSYPEPGTVQLTYPIRYDETGKPLKTSWPRCFIRPDAKKGEGEWRKFDNFEFEIFTAFNRSDEEYLPASLHLGTRTVRTALAFSITGLRQNRWVRVSVPLTRLGGKDPVSHIQLHLNARQYRPNDLLTLKMRNFKLTRMLEWLATDFRLTAPRIYSTRRSLPVEFTLLGPGQRTAVPFRIYDAQHRPVQSIMLPSPRAFGYRTLPIGALTPGSYTLAIYPDDARRRQERAFAVVRPPWDE